MDFNVHVSFLKEIIMDGDLLLLSVCSHFPLSIQMITKQAPAPMDPLLPELTLPFFWNPMPASIKVISLEIIV